MVHNCWLQAVNKMGLSDIIEPATRLDASSDQEERVARRLFFMTRGREPDASDLRSPLAFGKLGRIRAGNLILIELEPLLRRDRNYAG